MLPELWAVAKAWWCHWCWFAALGAGFGIGRIGGSAMEAIARQPEASGDIRANMIIIAALVESVALFGSNRLSAGCCYRN